MSEHTTPTGEKVPDRCSECGRPNVMFRVNDFVEVELSGEWLRGLIVRVSDNQKMFSVAVVGYPKPLAYGNPEVIAGAEKFLRLLEVRPADPRFRSDKPVS